MKEIKNPRVPRFKESSEIILYEEDSNVYFSKETIETVIGKIRRAEAKLGFRDIVDGWKARWGINRNNYKISPGIYAVGRPDENSQVLITANYKFTFDKLRKELNGFNLWIVALDTKGINVWCAAGKGTFGTAELVTRIKKIKLSEFVKHRNIIVPQLGATGIAAHIVARATGFRVIYGPVAANDIPRFLNSGLVADESMRQVRFNAIDRLALTPIELVNSLKYVTCILAAVLILNCVALRTTSINTIIKYTFLNSFPYLGAVFIAAVILPVLLPFIPFRAFSLKGLLLGILWSIACILNSKTYLFTPGILSFAANSLIICSITSYLGLNFTGSTTYTSLSGVVKETKITFPAAVAGGILGFLLLILYKLIPLL